MKKVILAAVLVSFFLAAFSAQGYAEEKKDEKTHITIGIKTWINNFTSYDNDTSHSTEGSNTVVMAGPILGITWDKYFAGVSYLKTLKDYESTYRQTNYTEKDKDDRQELDLSLGYYVHQRVGVFLGYKNVWWREDGDGVDGGVAFKEVTRYRLFGPLVGLTANYPIGQTGLTPFITGAYYWLRQIRDSNPRTIRQEGNMPAESLEVGLAYTYRSVTLTAGHKWQNMNGDNERTSFKGPIFSINYGF